MPLPSEGLIVFGIQKDPATNNWYFIIFADQERTRVAHESEPLYVEEEDATAAALDWLRRTQRK